MCKMGEDGGIFMKVSSKDQVESKSFQLWVLNSYYSG